MLFLVLLTDSQELCEERCHILSELLVGTDCVKDGLLGWSLPIGHRAVRLSGVGNRSNRAVVVCCVFAEKNVRSGGAWSAQKKSLGAGLFALAFLARTFLGWWV